VNIFKELFRKVAEGVLVASFLTIVLSADEELVRVKRSSIYTTVLRDKLWPLSDWKNIFRVYF